MTRDPLPEATPSIRQRRRNAAPEIEEAWRRFSQSVFAPGALDTKQKQLIAVAVAHVTQCPYCIRGHVQAAHRHGATEAEIMEAIWVAAEMRAGGAFAHSTLALHELAACHAHDAARSAPTTATASAEPTPPEAPASEPGQAPSRKVD